jgi:hypothetical protein
VKKSFGFWSKAPDLDNVLTHSSHVPLASHTWMPQGFACLLPGSKFGPSTMLLWPWAWRKRWITSWLNPHGVVLCIKKIAATYTRLLTRLRVKRDYLAIRDRVREAQIGFLQLPGFAMFSKGLPASSRVMDIVSGLDCEP